MPIMGLEDFERYAYAQMDSLRHLSLSALESMSFEREALRWARLPANGSQACAALPASFPLPIRTRSC